MIFPSRSQLASKQITWTGRAEAVTKEGLAATLLPARQPDRMGRRTIFPFREGTSYSLSSASVALPISSVHQRQPHLSKFKCDGVRGIESPAIGEVGPPELVRLVGWTSLPVAPMRPRTATRQHRLITHQ